MYRSILLPLDGSPLAETAARPALEIARRCGARVHIVHVALDETPFGWSMLPAEEGARDYLQGIADRIGVSLGREPLLTTISTGGRGMRRRARAVAESLVTYAEVERVDLIVMASHRRSAVGRAIVGSVGDLMLRLSPRPVLLVGAEPRWPEEWTSTPPGVLVALDGSARGESVLAPAADLARGIGARLIVARVCQPTVEAGLPIRLLGAPPTDDDGSWLADEEAYLEEVVAGLAADDLDVTTRAALGWSVVNEILAIAEEEGAGVIALAGWGTGGFGRLLFGSVTTDAVQSTSRPILVAPTGDGAGGISRSLVHAASACHPAPDQNGGSIDE
ncbi:MAG: universal stress protein [Gemmatimonadota bacterium]